MVTTDAVASKLSSRLRTADATVPQRHTKILFTLSFKNSYHYFSEDRHFNVGGIQQTCADQLSLYLSLGTSET